MVHNYAVIVTERLTFSSGVQWAGCAPLVRAPTSCFCLLHCSTGLSLWGPVTGVRLVSGLFDSKPRQRLSLLPFTYITASRTASQPQINWFELSTSCHR